MEKNEQSEQYPKHDMEFVNSELEKIHLSVQSVAERLASLAKSFAGSGNPTVARNLFSEASILTRLMSDLRAAQGAMVANYVAGAEQASLNMLNAALAATERDPQIAEPAVAASMSMRVAALTKVHVAEDTVNRLMCNVVPFGYSHISFDEFQKMWPFQREGDDDVFCKICLDKASKRAQRANRIR
jgi:hypothetical protein